MTPQSVHKSAFSVIGFAARTSNAAELSGPGRIGPLWRDFMMARDGSIPGVLDRASSYSVCTNYETDETGAYDVILGKSVSDSAAAPASMRGIQIPEADYLVFPAANATPGAIMAAWQSVYLYFAGSAGAQRSFTFDFEHYGADGIHLYIAVK